MASGALKIGEVAPCPGVGAARRPPRDRPGSHRPGLPGDRWFSPCGAALGRRPTGNPARACRAPLKFVVETSLDRAFGSSAPHLRRPRGVRLSTIELSVYFPG